MLLHGFSCAPSCEPPLSCKPEPCRSPVPGRQGAPAAALRRHFGRSVPKTRRQSEGRVQTRQIARRFRLLPRRSSQGGDVAVPKRSKALRCRVCPG
jgi:hypothetical protein